MKNGKHPVIAHMLLWVTHTVPSGLAEFKWFENGTVLVAAVLIFYNFFTIGFPRVIN